MSVCATPRSHVCSISDRPFIAGSPLHPFITQLEWAAGIVRTDSAAEKLDKLEDILEGSSESKAEVVPLLAALLSIPFGRRYPALQFNEQVQKQRIMQRCWSNWSSYRPRSGPGRLRGRALDRPDLT